MKYTGTLIGVRNMAANGRFCHDVLGLDTCSHRPTSDTGAHRCKQPARTGKSEKAL